MGNTVISSFQVGKEAQRKVQYSKVTQLLSGTGRIQTYVIWHRAQNHHFKLNQDYLTFKQEEKPTL